jgi:hypothetical protein
MGPRIYTYKITFEEVPGFWYWGVHAEKFFNDGYMGSPTTNKHFWELYIPKRQILEIFEYSEKGWKEANAVERRLIMPDLNHARCLNESCAGVMSLKVYKQNGERLHQYKNAEGKSVNAVKGGEKASSLLHQDKNAEGKSIAAVQMGLASHRNKDNKGRSTKALKMLAKRDEVKNEQGKSVKAYNAGKEGNKVEWMDPDHPELGVTTAAQIVRMQKRRGYPHSKENRVKVPPDRE